MRRELHVQICVGEWEGNVSLTYNNHVINWIFRLHCVGTSHVREQRSQDFP